MSYKYNNLSILNKPDKVYIKCDNSKDYTIIPKNGEYIYKCSSIAHTKGEDKEYIYSPISGRFLETIYESNEKYFVLENDYKEINENLKGINKNIDKILYEDFILKLKQSGITKNNISIDLNYTLSNKKYLIIDFFDNSYLLAKYLLNSNTEEILETIDSIVEINKLKSSLFLINKKDKKTIKLLEQKIGTYLKFKIVPISERKKYKKINKIIKKYNIKNNEIIQENINDILNIKNILKYNIPFIEKYIILRNNKNVYPLKVKNGSKISYIFKELNINISKYSALINNTKYDFNNEELIIDNNISEIII